MQLQYAFTRDKMKFSAFLLLAILFASTLSEKLPSDFQRCKESDRNISVCLKSAVQDALIKLKNGLPDLKISPLHPLTIPSATIGEGTGSVHVVQNYKNFNIYGMADAQIGKFVAKLSSKNFEANLETLLPEARIQADYELNGRILLLPIVGSGKCNITLKNVEVNIKFASETYMKKGKAHWRVNEFKVELKPGKVVYNFQNLFNGDERLGQETNNVLNDNWKEVFDDVKSGYEEVLGTVFKDYANKMFAKIPHENLFLK